MLKIIAIKIVINTVEGRSFGVNYNFSEGFNIIRGNNTAGKSSLFQSMLYCLGLEELFGGKNEKTMQSVFKNTVDFEGRQYKVLESNIFVEIKNKTTVTVRRSVLSQARSSKLVDVYNGAAITDLSNTYEVQPMYVHDKGAATNGEFGFHAFLEQFIGWHVPEVLSNNGEYRKLYLQAIFSAFFIEQKSGWTDFLATIPFYGIKDTAGRVIEFSLNMDVMSNKKKKQELTHKRQTIESGWSVTFNTILGIANRGGISVEGISPTPEILKGLLPASFFTFHNNVKTPLSDHISIMRKEVDRVNSGRINRVKENITEYESLLTVTQNRLNDLSISYNSMLSDLAIGKDKVYQYKKQLKSIIDDLEKNKSARKVYQLGADLDIKIASNICPTCLQSIKDTLMPQEVQQTPMRLDDNIDYLDSQRRMVLVHIELEENNIKNYETSLERDNEAITNLRQQIRSIKTELISDERLPSEADIEKKVKLISLIEYYSRTYDELLRQVEKLKSFSEEWSKYLDLEQNLPKDYFSFTDRKKLNYLQGSFTGLLNKFGYRSKLNADIRISYENYQPVIQGEGVTYNIRFDSSATDLIRAIWSYTISIFKTSTEFNANHPMILLFDEPAQHSISDENFKVFLKELSECSNYKCQTFVFASFNNSDSEFHDITNGLTFKLTDIGDRLIRPIAIA